jgi:hypothetical protein
MIIRQSFITALILFYLLLFESNAQSGRIIVPGDIHYDLPEDHDMEWLKSKPDDIRQIKEYTANTANNWNDFMKVITATTSRNMTVSVIIQLGDLSEGLAGNPEKAGQMAYHTMYAIVNARTGIPWIIVKGNHDNRSWCTLGIY